MSLVSGLYRLAPADSYPSREEADRRWKVAVKRLVRERGREAVVARLRVADIPADQEVTRAWLVLEAMAAPERHESAAQGSW